MARFLIGLALLPSSSIALIVSARAFARLAAGEPSSWPFLGGFGVFGLAWAFGRWVAEKPSGPAGWASWLSRKLYVIGHELTHALAAWGSGAKVFGFKVGEKGGHVDLSHSNAFIALAPYCIPIYAVFVALGWRAALWMKPELSLTGEKIFLALMGMALSFHALKTFEVLWDNSQPDLSAAGGIVFSLAWIVLANGLVLLLLLKGLFPAHVSLLDSLKSVAHRTEWFWVSLYHHLRSLQVPAPTAAVR